MTRGARKVTAIRSAVEDRETEPAQPFRAGEDVALGDPAAADGETGDREGPTDAGADGAEPCR